MVRFERGDIFVSWEREERREKREERREKTRNISNNNSPRIAPSTGAEAVVNTNQPYT